MYVYEGWEQWRSLLATGMLELFASQRCMSTGEAGDDGHWSVRNVLSSYLGKDVDGCEELVCAPG